jgi:predicted dehydrogenase
MAASIEQAEMMISAARETKGLLAIGLYRRYFTAAEAIRSIIANQTLGSLARFRICEGGPFGWQAASESFFRRGATPGGVLYDTGVHTLDLLIWWLGEPSEIGYEDDAMGGLEANCKLALSYDNECKGEIRLSRDWKTDNQYAFFFERGNVKWTVNDANHLELYGDGMPASVRGELLLHPETGERRAPYRPALTNPQCFIEQVRNLAAAKRGEVAIRVSGDEGIRSLRLIDRCYKQREMMDMPWLTDEEMLVARRCSRATTERRRW